MRINPEQSPIPVAAPRSEAGGVSHTLDQSSFIHVRLHQLFLHCNPILLLVHGSGLRTHPQRDAEARRTENSTQLGVFIHNWVCMAIQYRRRGPVLLRITSRGTPPLLSLFKAELEYVSFGRPAKRERVTPIACNNLPTWIESSQEGAKKPRCVSARLSIQKSQAPRFTG